MRIRLPAGSRKAQSRTPYGCSVGSWTTSTPLAHDPRTRDRRRPRVLVQLAVAEVVLVVRLEPRHGLVRQVGGHHDDLAHVPVERAQ
jgi:hypothetical protein